MRQEKGWAVKPRDNSSFIFAMLTAIPAVLGMIQLYESRDISQDYFGLLWLFICVVWLYRAYRKPKSNAVS